MPNNSTKDTAGAAIVARQPATFGTMAEKKSDRSAEDDEACCLSGCHSPRWQPCANVKLFVGNFTVVLVLLSIYSTYQIGVLTTIERRFQFPSKYMGAILAANDIGSAFFVMILCHIGSNKRKPAFITYIVQLSTLGIFLASVPHYIYGGGGPTASAEVVVCTSPLDNRTEQPVCVSNGAFVSSESRVAFILMFLGGLLIGTGLSPLYSLGVVYIDDNVQHKATVSYYMGITQAVPLVGMMVGFLLAALTVLLPDDLKDTTLSPDDPAFMGAWWLGLVIVSVVLVLVSFPMACFPKRLPGGASNQARGDEAADGRNSDKAAKTEEAQAVEAAEQLFEKMKAKPKEMFREVWRLLKNPVLVCFALGGALDMYSFSFLSFLPKYLERQFGQTASTSSIATGFVVLVAAASTLVAGYMIRRFKVQLRGIVVITLAFSLITAIFGCICMLVVGCAIPWASETDTQPLEFNTTCSDGCSCEHSPFSPVCSADEQNGTQVFANCNCTNTVARSVQRGICEQDCPAVYAYLVVIYLAILLAAPGFLTTIIGRIRCVEVSQKPLAMAIGSLTLTMLNSLPGPVIFGAAIDSTCVVWAQGTCEGETGACIAYDHTRLRHVFHGVLVAFKLAAALCYAFAWYKVKGPYLGDSDDDYVVHSDTLASYDNKAFSSSSSVATTKKHTED
ncbi:PREDICTED: solute carrier organic anion transporter family member 3A1-like isoform X2 [Priapulus caudatus]|uniref:Solute carrier organic anion transporter family member n=1 Tax=Priapulus caudatus TaxID=37621 RepID=A0ABM1E872_PRICU|nr:PREDICTED: solute carrier organic anion transporter family member 3A1-like isoform X2 [Priapulus caudatus]